jgi:hypothetical protein
MTVNGITLRVDLPPGEAAGLKRLADKTGGQRRWQFCIRMLIKKLGAIKRERSCVRWHTFMKHWRQ